MDVKRYFRGPLLWVLLFGLMVALVMWGVNPDASAEKADTSKVVTAIQNGEVKSAKLIDKDQRIEITLKNPKDKKAEKLTASWVQGQGVKLQELLQKQADAGKLPGNYNIEVP